MIPPPRDSTLMASSPCLSLLLIRDFGSHPMCPLQVTHALASSGRSRSLTHKPETTSQAAALRGLCACLWLGAPGLCLHTAPDFRRSGYLLSTDEETKVLGGYQLWPLASGWKLVTVGGTAGRIGQVMWTAELLLSLSPTYLCSRATLPLLPPVGSTGEVYPEAPLGERSLLAWKSHCTPPPRPVSVFLLTVCAPTAPQLPLHCQQLRGPRPSAPLLQLCNDKH